MKLAATLGAVLLTAMGCAAEPTRDPDPMPDPMPEPTKSELECEGVEIEKATIAGELSVGDDGFVTVTAHNQSGADQTIEITLHSHTPAGLSSEVAPPVVLVAGASGGVRIAIGDVNGDGTALKAELVVRSADGQIAQRVFATGRAGLSVAQAAVSHGLNIATTVDGQPVELAGIITGGRGLDPNSLLAANDASGDFVAPAPPPGTYSYNMCFRWPVTLADAGFGEDYGVDPTSPWVARGGRVSIVQQGETVFDGWLDGSGCTGTFAAIASTDFSIFGYSRARVAGNELVVRDAGGTVKSFVIWDADPASKTPTFVFPEVAAVSTMLAVSAYTVTKLHGGITNQTIALENRCRPNGCCNCSSGGSIWITSPDRKFLISHELGHRILAIAIDGYNNDTSFDISQAQNPGACDTTTSHSMWSIENESGAAMEGWAHFVAVTAFNSTDGTNPGARMRYWSGGGTNVDVEEGAMGGESQYFHNACPGVDSATKMSVELDWLRHWWDYYTNATDGDPGVRPSYSHIIDELAAAPPWNPGTAYTNMRLGVESVTGADQLARWDQMGTWNGIK